MLKACVAIATGNNEVIIAAMAILLFVEAGRGTEIRRHWP